MRLKTLAWFGGLVAGGGCGSSHSTAADARLNDSVPPDPSIDAPTSLLQRFNPWKVGSVWAYKLTDPNPPNTVALDKLTTILAEEDVGGVHAGTTAFKVHIEQLAGSKDVWEGYLGDFDIRYQTIHYDLNGGVLSTDVDTPFRLKLDESPLHVVTGATFSQSFTELVTGTGAGTRSKAENWQVISDNESVTVLAGTFTCLHVRRTGSAPQDYWYARGVGKVKETGSGAQNEELMSFTP